MNGAIFFSSQYGSTAQYVAWIGEAADLPVFDVKDGIGDPSDYQYFKREAEKMGSKCVILGEGESIEI
ncbi:MAG: hypothetical protein ACR2PZ_11630 [Pseudomonadales bacterium]